MVSSSPHAVWSQLRHKTSLCLIKGICVVRFGHLTCILQTAPLIQTVVWQSYAAPHWTPDHQEVKPIGACGVNVRPVYMCQCGTVGSSTSCWRSWRLSVHNCHSFSIIAGAHVLLLMSAPVFLLPFCSAEISGGQCCPLRVDSVLQ